MTIKNFSLLFAFLGVFTFLTSCQKDNDSNEELKGSAQFEITDAPIDDANVSAAFVTISEIKVDGKSIEGFNKTTIDILAYQNGNTKLLADTDIEAKSYSNITLVLDFEEDANGNSPGCYVEENNGSVKHKLASTSNEITVNHNFNVEADSQSQIVLDFDLRKCIKKEDNENDKYEFVSSAEMEAGIRVVSKSNVGIIKGNCNDIITGSDKIVVYAYKKGDYNRNAEVQGQGQSNIEFANAVTSSSLDANGNYELHFLEEGEYEIHYSAYEEKSDGEVELKGMLIADLIGSLDLGAVEVDASASVTVDVLITGILPL
ncbi:DUF4382 domain-containing protein [Portibacter lacus]|uniref:DUF4382 domain-containing protein n=1 Tax=Portibacter lacus TaxID=1099794 RepID=A0AA37WFS9_9BACT|nr:DUF4382 domain-containing protein [Portibacter lacus]GLR19078.1 hypothetical protein GCM10007940_36940 [Portibacter lacus]